MLAENLKKQGKETEVLKYPVYDIEPTGPQIDRFLRDPNAPKITAEELQMWYALNRFQAQPELQKKLEQGITVIAEDYTGTGIAWGITHGADKAWVEAVNKYLLKEDLAILLDGEQFQTERETQHINEAHDERIAKCRQIHLDLAKQYGWKVVNANGEKEKIAEEILGIVKRHGL